MNRPKILLLSPFFHPENISTGKYNTVLAQALARAGAEVEVLASHPFYPAWKPLHSDARLDGVSIIRGGAWIRYPSIIILRRLVFEAWYALYVWWNVRKRRLNPDVVIAVFPPVLFFSVGHLFSDGCRKIGIVHDFQSILGLAGGNVVSRLMRYLVRKMESHAFQRCHRLVLLSQSMARVAQTEYGIAERCTQVAYPFVTLINQREVSQNLVSMFAEECQHVVYSGALGTKQNPLALFEFFRVAAARLPGVRFHIFSDGPVFEKICRMYSDNAAPIVALHKLVPDPDLPELYARSSVQVIPQAQGTSDACLPSKLPNILAAGCAVFAICEQGSELSEIVTKCAGVAVSEWDVEILVTRLAELLTRVKREDSRARQARVSRLLEAEFSVDTLLRTVLDASDQAPDQNRWGIGVAQASNL